MPYISDRIWTNNEVILCPTCQNFIQVAPQNCDMTHEIMAGKGICTQPRCMEAGERRYNLEYRELGSPARHPEFDITFTYSTIDNTITVSSHNNKLQYHVHDIPKLQSHFKTKQIKKMTRPEYYFYALLKGTKTNYHLIDVFTSSSTPNHITLTDSSFRVQKYPSPVPPPRHTTIDVYVISVGLGDKYRIIEITADYKQAVKIASSIRGKISTYKAGRNQTKYKDQRFYKWFSVLRDEENTRPVDFHAVDVFARRVSLDSDDPSPPMVTRRRRYNDSLPLRLEVAAVEESTCAAICTSLKKQLDNDELDLNIFEYNVDYHVEHIDNKWRIKPCLLQAQIS